MIAKTTQSLRCSLTMRSSPQESLQVCRTHHRCQQEQTKRYLKTNRMLIDDGMRRWFMYVRVAVRPRRRKDPRAQEEGELGIQQVDVASRERVYWEPIGTRPIIPATRLSSKALTPLCSCLASITSSLAFLSASFLFFLSSLPLLHSPYAIIQLQVFSRNASVGWHW